MISQEEAEKLRYFDEIKEEKEALEEIAKESIKRKTGARGLRSIIEELLLDVMYDIPSKENIKTCTITRENVLNKTKPLLK